MAAAPKKFRKEERMWWGNKRNMAGSPQHFGGWFILNYFYLHKIIE
jgi:hypothetical protein